MPHRTDDKRQKGKKNWYYILCDVVLWLAVAYVVLSHISSMSASLMQAQRKWRKNSKLRHTSHSSHLTSHAQSFFCHSEGKKIKENKRWNDLVYFSSIFCFLSFFVLRFVQSHSHGLLLFCGFGSQFTKLTYSVHYKYLQSIDTIHFSVFIYFISFFLSPFSFTSKC